jgi:hypothetical protein
MSPPARADEGLGARAVIALMRAVPGLFTLGWVRSLLRARSRPPD